MDHVSLEINRLNAVKGYVQHGFAEYTGAHTQFIVLDKEIKTRVCDQRIDQGDKGYTHHDQRDIFPFVTRRIDQDDQEDRPELTHDDPQIFEQYQDYRFR